ncbi:MAG: hypothetical protein H7338_24050 [Candidatus Sericytochromatia bacterium]|nr:hypothetical protein [Candidatus Sericytochromatia bacterium]
MSLKRLIAAGCLAGALLTGCASTLQTHRSPAEVHTSVESLLKAKGFTGVQDKEDAGALHVHAVRIDGVRYTERTFKIEQGPSTRVDPIAQNGNMTTFEERVDPTRFTSTDRSDTVLYQVDVALAKAGTPRKVTVKVTASPVPASNKYREIIWIGNEPLSARQIEESLYRSLEKTL